MKRLILLLLPLFAILPGSGLPAVAAAAGLSRSNEPRVALDVVDRQQGSVIAQYPHRGQTWLAGEPGQRYAVRLRNLGPRRVLVVLSVDGINAITGQTADTGQAGYVLGPWEQLDVEGWRKSMDTVAGFVFVHPDRSYAARTGRPDQLGVIGIAVFDERPSMPAVSQARPWETRAPPLRREHDRMPQAATRAAAAAADAASGAYAFEPSAPGLGTGHGRIESAPAHAAAFERQSRPAQVVQVRYDSWRSLLARGVPVAAPRTSRGWNDMPQAFPNRFVPDPPCCATEW